jgi:hypothetical protein
MAEKRCETRGLIAEQRNLLRSGIELMVSVRNQALQKNQDARALERAMSAMWDAYDLAMQSDA